MDFNLTRLGLLIQRKFHESGKNYLFGIAIGTGIVLALSSLNLLGGTVDLNNFRRSALLTYLIGGVIVSSLAFSEINKPETGYQFMTLPASSIEKFVSTWFFTSIVYSVIAFVALILGTLLLSAIGTFGFNTRGDMFEFSEMFGVFKQYLFGNALFLAGAAAFKRNAFFKTMLVVLVLFFFFGIYAASLAQVFGITELAANNASHNFSFNGMDMSNHFKHWRNTSTIVQAITAVFLLVVGFFKFKEREL